MVAGVFSGFALSNLAVPVTEVGPPEFALGRNGSEYGHGDRDVVMYDTRPSNGGRMLDHGFLLLFVPRPDWSGDFS